ncbi:MAG: glycosyltransferase family 25 protein [Rhodobacteraceae bacterium]|nr:glycosyltransferase family 25 protein [Paracoccaceae bacterium]
MIPIYFINLPSAVKRREWFERQIAGLELGSVRVEACDGARVSEQDLLEYNADKSHDKRMGPAEIGCLLSHRKTWKLLLEANDPWAFVAEDDLHLAKDCTPLFLTDDWIPESADLIKAETTYKKCLREKVAAGHCSTWSCHRLRSLHGGSGGYFIRSSAANLLVEATDDLFDHIDSILFSPDLDPFNRLSVHQLEPAIGLQDIFFRQSMPNLEKSSIVTDRINRKPRIYRKLVRELVRPYNQIKREITLRRHARKHNLNYSRVDYAEFAPYRTASV